MEKKKTHKDLIVWNKSMDLVEDIYRITETFPKKEIYGLTSQLRRAAVSIPSNIAEGSARQNTRELIQFLYIALGSLSEIETQVEIALRLKYCDDILKPKNKIDEIRRMLTTMIATLKKRLT
jgi:four helix bundle protein